MQQLCQEEPRVDDVSEPPLHCHTQRFAAAARPIGAGWLRRACEKPACRGHDRRIACGPKAISALRSESSSAQTRTKPHERSTTQRRRTGESARYRGDSCEGSSSNGGGTCVSGREAERFALHLEDVPKLAHALVCYHRHRSARLLCYFLRASGGHANVDRCRCTANG